MNLLLKIFYITYAFTQFAVFTVFVGLVTFVLCFFPSGNLVIMSMILFFVYGMSVKIYREINGEAL